MRIALVAPPWLPVPPRGYAGTERVIEVLATGLHRRGHAVTLFAPGDSRVECELVPTIDRSLWNRPDSPEDPQPFFELTRARLWRERARFDVIHSHLEVHGFQFARQCPTPVVSTLHGRLDLPGLPELIAEFSEIPLVSVSDNQRRWYSGANWVATVHHGLPLESVPHSDQPGGYLALVGRLSPEKGIAEAIQLARQVGLPLRVAAKQRGPDEERLYREVLEPAVREGVAEYLGEIGAPERDTLYAGALATLMLGAWPEPFGLVAIESLAAGTPVIARKAGSLPEIIEHGVDGFLVDDVIEASLAIDRVRSLNRGRIRARALARFSADRMVDAYERVYRRVVDDARARRDGDRRLAGRARVELPPLRNVPLLTEAAGQLAAGGARTRGPRTRAGSRVAASYLDRIDAEPRRAPVARQRDRVVVAGAHETQTELTLMQPALERAEAALHPPVLEPVPVPRGDGEGIPEPHPRPAPSGDTIA